MRRRPWSNLEANSLPDRLDLPRRRESKELLIRSELLRSRSSLWNKTNKLYYVLFCLIFRAFLYRVCCDIKNDKMSIGLAYKTILLLAYI